MLKLCIDNAALVVRFNKQILVYSGQGDGLTKWKGWSWKLLLNKFVILFIVSTVSLIYSYLGILDYQAKQWKGNKSDNRLFTLFTTKLSLASKMNRTSIMILTVSCSTVEL